MLNSMAMPTFSVWDRKYPCRENVIKYNCLFKVKFGTSTILNVLNSMVTFSFIVLY